MVAWSETPKHTPSIARWIEAARGGCDEALGRLLQTCRNYLLLVANQELQPGLQGKVSPSDLVQDTFLKAHRGFPTFEGHSEAELLAWLRRILLNNVANATRAFVGTEMRQLDREVATDSADGAPYPAAPGESPSALAIGAEQNAALEVALERLPEHYRQVVVWRSLDEESFEQIGRRTGRSAEAARKLWARAIEQLQTLLEQKDDRAGPAGP